MPTMSWPCHWRFFVKVTQHRALALKPLSRFFSLFFFTAVTVDVEWLPNSVELVNRTVHWQKCMSELGI